MSRARVAIATGMVEIIEARAKAGLFIVRSAAVSQSTQTAIDVKVLAELVAERVVHRSADELMRPLRHDINNYRQEALDGRAEINKRLDEHEARIASLSDTKSQIAGGKKVVWWMGGILAFVVTFFHDSIRHFITGR